jgi:hypothetical protein
MPGPTCAPRWSAGCGSAPTSGCATAARHQAIPEDNLPAISRYLLWRVDGLALLDIGPEAVDEITDAVAKCHRLIDRRAEKMYAGKCSSETDDGPCPEELYVIVMSGEVGMVTTLTRADRCDRCGAAAQVRVEMTAGELLFCQHHADRYKDCLPSQPTPSPRATTLQSE